ncbi:hypothetical protein C2G38_2244545 [Gigaspora rosea]|uniref:Uncharacterized protein n=1 Tax=Gigaspora rosea TaxID=44941 RepID=A0A397VF89_9GLOM|nr:hypothetical protein C2G38_2244545 [Gigaspora rosea]
MLSKFYLVFIIALVFTAALINSAPVGRDYEHGTHEKHERPFNVENNKKETKVAQGLDLALVCRDEPT